MTPARCDGCDKIAPLRAFSNRKAYCERCSEEVVAFGWARPLPSPP